METCANCGGTIGNLEDPYLWRERVVCLACYRRLAEQAPAGIPVATTPVAFDTPLPLSRPHYDDRLWHTRMYCLLIGLFLLFAMPILSVPFLVVWIALGIHHLIRKSEGR